MDQGCASRQIAKANFKLEHQFGARGYVDVDGLATDELQRCILPTTSKSFVPSGTWIGQV